MKKETINDLITLRCLSLLFYNFTNDDIIELRKIREFDHCWGELQYKVKKKKWGSTPDIEFYGLFSIVSYTTQSQIIEYAKEKYGFEATRGVNLGLESIELFKNFQKRMEGEG